MSTSHGMASGAGWTSGGRVTEAWRVSISRPAGCAHPVRILLTEDHADTAWLMSRILVMTGHQVEVAPNVACALRADGRAHPDLLLSDLGLPDGTGWDLLRAMRAQGMRGPAIAVSAYNSEGDMRASREAGFAAHIVKPVEPEHLLKLIAELSKAMH